MNCDSCGALPQAPRHSCNCNDPDCAPSQSSPFSQTPFGTRRWFLRRTSLRKPDPNTSNSSCSDDYRKPEDHHHSQLSIESPEPNPAECQSEQHHPSQHLDQHPAVDHSEPVLPDEPRVEIADADPDLDDADLDAGSMEVSAAQSETASTISRAAFSVGDKAEVEIHPPVLTTAHPAEERRKAIPSETRPGVRAQLRAAYVRELLLSSLSL